MKKAIALFLLVASGYLAGCNTIHGFGRDVEKVGEKVQEKSAR